MKKESSNTVTWKILYDKKALPANDIPEDLCEEDYLKELK